MLIKYRGINMKNLILLLTIFISLITTNKLYAEEISEKDQLEIEKILDLDLNSLLEYSIECSDELETLIQNMIDEYSDDDLKEKIVETLNSTEIEDISIDNIESLLLNYTERFDILKEPTNDSDAKKM